jgi:mannose-1-phosphate guanylyltransferase
VLDFQEKPPAEKARSTTVNTGIYVFEPEIIERIPTGTSYDIGGQLFPRLAAEKTDAGRPSGLYGTVLPFEWLDIGKVTDYYYVMQQAVQGQVRGLRMPGTQVAEGIWTGINVRLDLSASRITPPVYVGGSSSVAPGATIVGPTMIGAGCFVESGAHIERSIVFDYTRVGPYAHVSDMIVCGNYCVKASGEVVDLGASDIDWVIADARSRLKALTQDQLELMESMQRHGVQ